MKIIAIVGRSGAGKTTLIRNLIVEFRRRNRTVAVIKHCGHGFDLGGDDKDSSLYLEAGAAAMTLTGARGTAVVRKPKRRPRDRELAAQYSEMDIVFIEGGRVDFGIPKIEVGRSTGPDRIRIPRSELLAIVSEKPEPSLKPTFPPDAIREIADLIEADREWKSSSKNEREENRFFARHDPDILPILRKGVVGIAGAGGLGSNVAVALLRAGVGKLIIADFDKIEISNLNRQQYFASQVGRVKVEALAENLRRIHPFSIIQTHRTRITPKNVDRLFGDAHILVEAFDRADQKQMLIETWMMRFPDRPIIAASGLSGYGANNRIKERRIGRLYLIGDEASEPEPDVSPMAPRVAVVAAMQANRAVECLVKMKRHRSSRSVLL